MGRRTAGRSAWLRARLSARLRARARVIARVMAVTGVIATVSLVAVTGLGAAPGSAESADASRAAATISEPPVEAAHCRHSVAPAPSSGVAEPDRTVVEVQVRTATELRLDDGGRIVAARTNSGCAPGPADSIAVERDGRPVAATAAIVDQLAVLRWTGDWQLPGQWHEAATEAGDQRVAEFSSTCPRCPHLAAS